MTPWSTCFTQLWRSNIENDVVYSKMTIACVRQLPPIRKKYKEKKTNLLRWIFLWGEGRLYTGLNNNTLSHFAPSEQESPLTTPFKKSKKIIMNNYDDREMIPGRWLHDCLVQCFSLLEKRPRITPAKEGRDQGERPPEACTSEVRKMAK